MSLNKYNPATGNLENIASGQRTAVYTKEAYETAKEAGTLPTDTVVMITDDLDNCEPTNFNIDEEVKIGNMGDYSVYRKVVQFTGSTGQTSKSFNFSSNAVGIISVRGMVGMYPLNYFGAYAVQDNYMCSIYNVQKDGSYSISIGSSVSNRETTIIVEYYR